MVVVPQPINQYPIRKRVFKISKSLSLWVLRSSSTPYIRNLIPSLLHIHSIHNYPINTFMTIPDVIASIPVTPGLFRQITPIPTTKYGVTSAQRPAAYTHSQNTPNSSFDAELSALQQLRRRFAPSPLIRWRLTDSHYPCTQIPDIGECTK